MLRQTVTLACSAIAMIAHPAAAAAHVPEPATATPVALPANTPSGWGTTASLTGTSATRAVWHYSFGARQWEQIPIGVGTRFWIYGTDSAAATWAYSLTDMAVAERTGWYWLGRTSLTQHACDAVPRDELKLLVMTPTDLLSLPASTSTVRRQLAFGESLTLLCHNAMPNAFVSADTGTLAKVMTATGEIGFVRVAALRMPEPPTATMCQGVQLSPADAPNIPAIAAAKPLNTTFCFAPGTYPMTDRIQARTGDRFIGAGQGRTILRGSRRIDGWAGTAGSSVAHAGGARKIFDDRGKCRDGSDACRYQDWLLADGRFLNRVLDTSPDDATGGCAIETAPAGSFCVDYLAALIYTNVDTALHAMTYSNVETAISVGGASGGVVQGMTVREYASSSSNGAVTASDGWVVADVEAAYNHGAGIKVSGVGPVVRASHSHHNGQRGAGGGASNATITGREFDHNNLVGFDNSWDAGGIKLSNGSNVTLRNNRIHDNSGSGLWFDVDYRGATVAGNVIERNHTDSGGGDGIRVEISCDMTITGNTVRDNDRSQINLVNAKRVTVGGQSAGNTVVMGALSNSGIRVSATDRTEVNDQCGAANQSLDNTVAYNDITMLTGTTQNGISRGCACANTPTSARNVFVGNTYHMPQGDCAAKRWVYWDGSGNRDATFAAWQSTYGQDAGGTCS